MALKDFTQEYQIEKHDLYVCIGIDQITGYGTESRINYLIDNVIEGLKSEMPDYNTINVAYVYETKGLMEIKTFAELSKDERPFYRDVCEKVDDHSMDHIFFTGMEILRTHKNDECRFYFLAEEKLPRINNILHKSVYGIQMNERYEGYDTKIILCKPNEVGEDLLEEYLLADRRGSVMRW